MKSAIEMDFMISTIKERRMDDMLRVFLEEDINEFHYRREDGVWKYELK